MGVLSKISVGDIFYYSVDAIPSHTAPKGSVAIIDVERSIYDNGFTYINNDGGTVWLKCVEPKYGEISLGLGTTEYEMVAAPTTWNGYNSTESWTLNSNSHKDFILAANDGGGADDLEYTGSTTMRAICRQSSVIRAGTTRHGSFETGVSFNFTVPLKWNEGFSHEGPGTGNIQSQHILEFTPNDYILGARAVITVESGNPSSGRQAVNKYMQVSALKIDEPLVASATTTSGITMFDETFESSGFTENSWTVVNDATNVWVVGQAESFSGTSSAYVSNDGGVSAAYTITVAATSHFYKDFVLPLSSMTLTFDWKCEAENAGTSVQYDYGAVVITDTGTTPTAGSEVITTLATAGTNGRLGAGTNLGKFNLAYGTTPGTVWNSEAIDLSSYSGSTKRLVFTWQDDGSVGVMPPFIVDNIKITTGSVSTPEIIVY